MIPQVPPALNVTARTRAPVHRPCDRLAELHVPGSDLIERPKSLRIGAEGVVAEHLAQALEADKGPGLPAMCRQVAAQCQASLPAAPCGVK